MLTAAQQKMVEDNLGLVQWTITHKFSFLKPYELDDAWAAGVMGLITAVERFDPEKAKLSTYAPIWIRQAIQKDRRAFNGSHFRALERENLVHEYRPPLLFSGLIAGSDGAGNGLLLEETFDDPAADTERDGIQASVVDEVWRAVAAVAETDFDRLLVEASQWDHVTSMERDRILAAEAGRSAEWVRRRRRQLAAKVRELVEVA